VAEDERPVIVAFDGSPESVEAVRTAATLFRDRRLLIVSVWEPGLAMATSVMPAGEIGGATYNPPSAEQIEAVDRAQREHAQGAAETGVRLATELGATAQALPVPDDIDITETLCSIAERDDAAALVVGSRGLGRVKSALLGSTSRRLLHHTRRPVVIVRPAE
jgi:nucleotide-binding universal stress UspA family protein